MSARNLVLILMFGGLIYGVYALYRSQTVQPLRADLISIDTARISQLRIHSKENGQIIQLQREDGSWIASNGQVHLRALPLPVQRILENLVKVTTVEVAAKNEADWQAFGLTPAQSVRVEIYQNNEQVEDFWIGHAASDPAAADSLAYIRIDQEREVYAVRGMETTPFFQTFPQFRSKRIIQLPDGASIDSFLFQLPDTLYKFEQSAGNWHLNGLPVAEPTVISKFLQNLRRIESQTFVDDFDHQQPGLAKHRSLALYLSRVEEPILVEVYQDTFRDQPYILRSTQNPTWFGSDSSGIYSRLFSVVDALSAKKEEPTLGTAK